MHRPTILQIIPRLDTGGAELSAIEINEAVVRGGGRSIVATEGGRMAGRITADGGELLQMSAGTKNPVRMMANSGNLARVIWREKVDLIHARSRAPAWSAQIAARRCRIPFVTTYHGAYSEKGPIKRLYNSVMARSTLVIANSEYTSRLIQSRYQTSPAKIRVVHRGVDETAFDPALVDPQRVAALSTRFGLTGAETVIVQAARLTSWKGQSVLIDAMSKLDTAGKLGTAVAVIAGDAQGRESYAASLRAQIEHHRLGEKVRLVGHVDDIPALLVLAGIAVVASTEPEAFGRSVAEAGSMGCPVIATDLGAPPEIVLSMATAGPARATGWLVEPGSADGLAEALYAALTMPEADRQAMGARARAGTCSTSSR